MQRKLHLQVAQLKADGQWECWESVPLIRPSVRGAFCILKVRVKFHVVHIAVKSSCVEWMVVLEVSCCCGDILPEAWGGSR